MDKTNLPNADYAHIVRTPLHKPHKDGDNLAHNPFLRATNEDDDGYDPYSDRSTDVAAPEKDPWR